MEQWTGSKSGKQYAKAIYCHPAYLTYMQSTSCEMPDWMKHKLESRLQGEISITSDDTTLMASSKEELKSLLMKVKEESEKSWLKTQHSKNKDHGIWSHHFMAKDGTTVETVTDFIFLSSKITADTGCRHEIKSFLLCGRKAMTNLDSILESRDITLPKKVCIVTAMLFPGVMYWCESWTIWKVKRQRTDAFELWCWRRLLRISWTVRRSNQPILK